MEVPCSTYLVDVSTEAEVYKRPVQGHHASRCCRFHALLASGILGGGRDVEERSPARLLDVGRAGLCHLVTTAAREERQQGHPVFSSLTMCGPCLHR